MNRQTLFDLKSQHPIDHEIDYLIWVIYVNGGNDMRCLRIVLSRANHKRSVRVSLGDQGNQFLHRSVSPPIK